MHPYAKLPTTMVMRMPDAYFRVLIVVISRGVGPLQPIAEAVTVAHLYGAGVALASGYPAVAAKNIAAELAEGVGAALLLIEDDVLADRDTWDHAMRPITGEVPVRFATAACRNGQPNTRWHALRRPHRAV